MDYNLSHLKVLEAEAIEIIREVAAEFSAPVMLYSIGKDSSVMAHIAKKAFYPAKVPFPSSGRTEGILFASMVFPEPGEPIIRQL